MGASDVVGVGAQDPAKEAWPQVLARLLPGRVALMRLGVSGGLASTIRTQFMGRAQAANPDVVVLFTGVNDCVQGVPLPQFERELDGLLAGLAKTTARVFVLGLPDIASLPAVKPYAAMLGGLVPLWQAAVRELAGRHGATVVDLGSFAHELDRHREYLAADGYHPSAVGYRRMAEAIAATLVAAGVAKE